MTKGKALKLSDVERIHADLIKHDEAKLAIAKKYRITLETLNKIDRVRKIARKYGPEATLRVRGHKVQKQSDQA
jgi:diaminopimelate decarboxylase